MIKKTILTPEGHKKLLAELDTLKAKRKDISLRIQEAKELGDLSENAEYHEAKNDQAFTEGRIVEIEVILTNAEIVQKKSTQDGVIGIGSSVIATNSNKEHKFTIVGANEADPINGKISNESPLGKSLIGKKIGDTISVKAPKGEIEYKIKGIS